MAYLKDRDKWIEEGRVPLCILSATDPTDPDNSYINSREFNQWSKRFIEERSDDLPEDVIEFKVRDMFQRILNYNFVHYPLSSERDIRDICNIFAKVNASGMKLSTFDLMNGGGAESFSRPDSPDPDFMRFGAVERMLGILTQQYQPKAGWH